MVACVWFVYLFFDQLSRSSLSYLIPYALGVCRDSRAFAQSRLRHTSLFRGWPRGSRRTIYFNPNCDIYIYRFTDLSWRMDFIPDQCLFDHVDIIANGSPDKVASTIGHGLRSTNFLERFPSLKHPLIREREGNLAGIILWNEWKEDRWNEESRLRQDSWGAE